MTQLKVNNINMCSTSNPLSTAGLYDTAHKPSGEWQHGRAVYTEHHHHHCKMQLSQGQEQAGTSPTTCDALLHLEDEGSASEEETLNCGSDEPERGSSRGGGSSSSSAGSLCTPPSESDLEQELELSVGSDQEEPVQEPEGEAQEVVISCTSVDVAQLSLLFKFMHGIQQASGAVLNARPVSPRLFSLCVMGTTSQVQQAVRLVSDVLLGEL